MDKKLSEFLKDRGNLFVVGEYTTNAGPFDEDHFLVIAFDNGREFEIPCSSDDFDGILNLISKELGIKKIDIRLFNSTDYNSRVIIPDILSGKPFYEFSKANSLGVIGQIKGLFYKRVEMKYSEYVERYLNNDVKEQNS